jgi:DNA-binding NtrC family response regulator
VSKRQEDGLALWAFDLLHAGGKDIRRVPCIERKRRLARLVAILGSGRLQGLETAGASVSVARTLRDALHKVEAPGLSAAVLDHRLNDGDSSHIRGRLDARNIPFVVYSGYAMLDGPCSEGKQVSKPVRPEELVVAVVNLLRDRQTT